MAKDEVYDKKGSANSTEQLMRRIKNCIMELDGADGQRLFDRVKRNVRMAPDRGLQSLQRFWKSIVRGTSCKDFTALIKKSYD